jgi:hypothetical protein
MHTHDTGIDLGWLLAGLPQSIAAVSLYLALVVTGVIAGATHCVGMCGPFVLTRAARVGAALPAQAVGPWLRLRAGVLPAYHLGRALTYSLLGAVAGTFGAGFASIVGLGWERHVFIGLAIVLLLAPLLFRVRAVVLPPQWGELVTRTAGKVARLPGLGGDFPLGAALGFLPCGMIYTALAAAAGAGGALEGALAMAAFAAGTWIPLAVVGSLGATAGRQLREHLRRWAVPLVLVNVLTLSIWLAQGH